MENRSTETFFWSALEDVKNHVLGAVVKKRNEIGEISNQVKHVLYTNFFESISRSANSAGTVLDKQS